MALQTVECQGCGYVRLHPQPTQEELDELYRNQYYQKHNPKWFEKERREQWYWQKVYGERLDYAAFWVNRNQRNLLDFGAGCGWFVRMAKGLGWDAWGYEISEIACNYADENVTTQVLNQWPFLKETISFIHCGLVLEHIIDPLEILEDLQMMLTRESILCIVVPNEFNPLQRQLADRFGYSPLHTHHVNYFTQESIKRLVERAGFEVVRVTSTFPMEWLALHGLNYVKHPILGKFAHWLRMVIEWAALTVAPERWERVRDGWAVKGWGREIELWCRKIG